MEALGHVKSFRAHAPKTRQGACGNLDRYIATEEIGRKGEEEDEKMRSTCRSRPKLECPDTRPIELQINMLGMMMDSMSSGVPAPRHDLTFKRGSVSFKVRQPITLREFR